MALFIRERLEVRLVTRHAEQSNLAKSEVVSGPSVALRRPKRAQCKLTESLLRRWEGVHPLTSHHVLPRVGQIALFELTWFLSFPLIPEM